MPSSRFRFSCNGVSQSSVIEDYYTCRTRLALPSSRFHFSCNGVSQSGRRNCCYTRRTRLALTSSRVRFSGSETEQQQPQGWQVEQIATAGLQPTRRPLGMVAVMKQRERPETRTAKSMRSPANVPCAPPAPPTHLLVPSKLPLLLQRLLLLSPLLPQQLRLVHRFPGVHRCGGKGRPAIVGRSACTSGGVCRLWAGVLPKCRAVGHPIQPQNAPAVDSCLPVGLPLLPRNTRAAALPATRPGLTRRLCLFGGCLPVGLPLLPALLFRFVLLVLSAGPPGPVLLPLLLVRHKQHAWAALQRAGAGQAPSVSKLCSSCCANEAIRRGPNGSAAVRRLALQERDAWAGNTAT